jgi:exodeoxyribonuclease VII small subunit
MADVPEKVTEDFEAALSRLEEIVAKMESGGLSLDETMTCFSEGMKRVDALTAMLAEARETVMKLVPDGDGGVVEQPFDEEGS